VVLRDVTKSFDGRDVVHDVTFEVQPGTITGFVGANGAGKTTTMRILLGLVRPTSGEALVAGRRYGELDAPRRVVGAAVDGPGAHPGHSGRTHLRIIAAAARLPRRRVDEVLELVDLDADAGRRVGGYSMGMRQRLALAAALLGDPQVLVLDEPGNGLDPAGMLWLRGLLRGLADDGRAVLVSSHLLGELTEVADRIAVLDRGRLVAEASVGDLAASQVPVVEVRGHGLDLLAQALRDGGLDVTMEGDALLATGSTARVVGEVAARVDGVLLHRLVERRPSLEDVYFRLASGDAVDERVAS